MQPDRSKARNALILNLLATPGLGTWMVGKRVTGALQAGLALAGFVLVLVWFLSWAIALLHGSSAERMSYRGLGLGVVVFVLSWCWGLISGLRVLRAAPPAQPPAAPTAAREPPKIL
jgi:hypothetical protein